MTINELNDRNLSRDAKAYRSYHQFSELLRLLRQRTLPPKVVLMINKQLEELNASPATEGALNRQIKQRQMRIVNYVAKEAKIVPRKYHRNLWMVLGMSTFGISFGVAFGLAVGNIGLLGIGLPIGMGVGILVGLAMDKKAAKEGETIGYRDEILMRVVSNIIFWVAMLAIVIRVAIPVIEAVFGLVLVHAQAQEWYYMLCFIGAPVAILLTLFKTIKKNDSASRTITVIFFTVFAAIIAFGYNWSEAFKGMCRYGTQKELFINQTTPSSKIYLARFGCGAIDSDTGSVSIIQIDTVFSIFTRTQVVDTINLDKEKWIRKL